MADRHPGHIYLTTLGKILGLRPANERRRYYVMPSLIGMISVAQITCGLWLTKE